MKALTSQLIITIPTDVIKTLIKYTEQPCTSLITEMLLSEFVHGDVTCF